RQALERDSDCVVCAANLAAALLARASPSAAQAREAEALSRHSIALSPRRPPSYRTLGVALAQQHRYDEAEAVFLEYMRREPRSTTGKADLGVLRVRQQRYAEAIPLLREAVVLNPRLQEPRVALARALRLRAAELRRESNADEADMLAREAEGILARDSAAGAPGSQRSTTPGRY